GARDRRQKRLVVQQRDLATGAAEALDAVGSRGDEQKAGGGRRADFRPVDRQLLPLRAALARVHVAVYPRPARARGGEELVAGLAVGRRKMWHGAHRGGASRAERQRMLGERCQVARPERDDVVVEVVAAVVQEAAALGAPLPEP